MKKYAAKTARTRIENLPRDLGADALLLVGGGEPVHDCVTASGATCDGDDCGPIRQGSTCGP